MAAATGTPTTSRVWDDGQMLHAIGTIAVSASPATYAAGGLACDMLASMVDGANLGLPLPGVGSQPLFVDINGIAGYRYEYDSVNKKLIIRGSAAHTHDLFLNNGDVADGATTRINAGTNLLGANTGSDITVTGLANGATSGRGGILGTLTAALGELTDAAAIPAGVSGDTIKFHAMYDKMR